MALTVAAMRARLLKLRRQGERAASNKQMGIANAIASEMEALMQQMNLLSEEIDAPSLGATGFFQFIFHFFSSAQRMHIWFFCR